MALITTLVALNFGLGTLRGLLKGEFELTQLPKIWRRNLFAFGSYITVAITGELADTTLTRDAMAVAVTGYLVAKCVANLKALGLPIPQKLLALAGK